MQLITLTVHQLVPAWLTILQTDNITCSLYHYFREMGVLTLSVNNVLVEVTPQVLHVIDSCKRCSIEAVYCLLKHCDWLFNERIDGVS